MTQIGEQPEETASANLRPAHMGMAFAGLAAPVLFIGLVIVQGALYPAYDHASMLISALAAEAHGWLQNLNFFATGGLMIIFAAGLHNGVRLSARSVIGPFLIALSGAGLAIAGAFPLHYAGGVLIEPPGHIAGSIAAFLAGGAGLMALSLRMAADARVRGYGLAIRLCGAATIVCFLCFAILAVPPEGPLHPVQGLVQRCVVGVWLLGVWLAALALFAIALRRPKSG